MRPVILVPIESIVVAELRPFKYGVSHGFSSQEGPVYYRLDLPSPSWLEIDSATAVITGRPPKISQDHLQFLVTVSAANAEGEVSQSFYIRVVCEDAIENITRLLLQLQYTPKIERHPHEILEFLFEFYHSSSFKYDFLHLLRQHAEKLDISLHEPPTYEDFKWVAETLHPGIEKELQQALADLHVLVEAELTHVEFSRLFEEGFQPLGVLPIAVWNYLGEASYHNWSELKTVLYAAVQALRSLNYHALQANANLHRLDLKLQPPKPKRSE